MKDLHKNDRLIALLAGLMAVISLTVAVWDGIETRNHNRLSVKPFLNFEVSRSTTQSDDGVVFSSDMTVKVENRGLGPAIIKSFEIISIIDGKQYINNDWLEALKTIDYKEHVSKFSSLGTNSIIQAEVSKTLINLSTISNALGSIKIRIVYESIYQEEFVEESESFDL